MNVAATIPLPITVLMKLPLILSLLGSNANMVEPAPVMKVLMIVITLLSTTWPIPNNNGRIIMNIHKKSFMINRVLER